MSYNELIDIDVLEDYLDGKLDAKAMHKIERISLEDPFVAQALAGLTEAKKRKQSLSFLQKQLQERIAQKPIEKKLWNITSQRLTIAATAAVLFVTVSLFFFMRENSRQKEKQTANNKPKQIDVTIAPETAAVTIKVDTPTKKTNADLEIDNAIASAKTNSYAKNNKKIQQQPLQDFAPAQAAPSLTMAVSSQEISYQNKEEKAKNAVLEAENRAQQKQTVSALRGRVAGVTLNTSNKSINGVVSSKDDGVPLTGVTVKIAGTNKTINTNVNGEFSIPVDSITNQRLTFNALGYNAKEININTNENIRIELEPNSNSLNEVVLTNAKRSKSITTSGPVIGWDDYNKYLKISVDKTLLANIQSPVPFVELSFSIDTNGLPKSIKIIKSGGKLYDAEAIRLLKNGSKWFYSPLNNTGNLKVDFSLF